MGSMQCNVEFGYQLSICSGTKVNLDGVGRSQDLPDANWLLASSPALNPRAQTLIPICAVAIFFSFFCTSCFLQLLLCAYDLDKHQTVCNTRGRNKCIYEQICIQIYIYPYLILHKFSTKAPPHPPEDENVASGKQSLCMCVPFAKP
jgi:hypothetical protein